MHKQHTLNATQSQQFAASLSNTQKWLWLYRHIIVHAVFISRLRQQLHMWLGRSRNRNINTSTGHKEKLHKWAKVDFSLRVLQLSWCGYDTRWRNCESGIADFRQFQFCDVIRYVVEKQKCMQFQFCDVIRYVVEKQKVCSSNFVTSSNSVHVRNNVDPLRNFVQNALKIDKYYWKIDCRLKCDAM
jgi:hypothetical protein